jgi:pimeloyl-ACP methyl ester carboxylesterase
MRWSAIQAFVMIPWVITGLATATPAEDFVNTAKAKHGEPGEKAARFLVEHMPPKDKETLSAEFLGKHLDLAFHARAEFLWAKQVPEELFYNDVLPYAVFDETRETWRAGLLEKARPLVKDAKSATEAAQTLNREFFNSINVHYHPGRKQPNQSPGESIASGKASCTGLSILLVDACRAVGIPARAVGTPMWTNGRGNHTWVEIWDGDWHFTGADEYDTAGLDRGWFIADAARAKADAPEHAIYATSWRKNGLSFPLIWAAQNRDVGAVNVTERYTQNPAVTLKPSLAVKLLAGEGPGHRVAATGWLTTTAGRRLTRFETKAGRADLNDLARVEVTPGESYRLSFGWKGGFLESDVFVAEAGESTKELSVSTLAKLPAEIETLAKGGVPEAPLSKDLAERAKRLLWEITVEHTRNPRAAELDAKTISFEGKTMRWLEKTSGEAPPDGRSLWISMHGGGNAPTALNDQQWRNQFQLYEPAEGIYVAPRAPTDTWNLWHEAHIDPMFARLIEDYVVLRDVNPDKVYLMGYSAGGDGVWQLAPRMADRFAAAAMMAGHPNEASLLGLRNLPFAILVGGADAGYDRNKVAAAKSAELARLEKDDPGGYVHLSRIYENLPHWMNRRDAEALPWMAQFKRSPWPKKLVWFQDDIIHDRFYWLKIPAGAGAKAGDQIIATVDGQTISLEGRVPARTELRLSDELLDLNQPVTVRANGKAVHTGKIPRTAAAMKRSLEERVDPRMTATAILVLP